MPLRHLLCLAIVLLTAFGANAAERVKLRIGEHPGFSRLVFDWAKPVGAKLDQGAGQAIINFDRSAELDLARFRADPPPWVSKIETATAGEGMTVTLTISQGTKLRLFEDEGNIVLDVLKPGTPDQAAAATPEEWRQRQAKGKSAPKAVETAKWMPPQPARKPDQGSGATASPAASPAALTGQLQDAEKPAAAAPPSAPMNIATALNEEPGAASPSSETAPAANSAPLSLFPPLQPETKGPSETKAEPETKNQAAPQADKKTQAAVKTSAGKTSKFAPKPKAKPQTQAAEALKTQIAAGDEKKPASGAAKTPTEVLAQVQTAVVTPLLSAPETPGVMPQTDWPEARVSMGEAPVLIEMSPSTARNLMRDLPPALHISWAGDVAAAAFRRGTNLWLVFDQPPPDGLIDGIRKLSPELESAELLDVPGATVIRLAAPMGLEPRLMRDGPAWIVELESAASALEAEIDVEVDAGGSPARVLFHAAGASKLVSFIDPEVGDRILVVPVAIPGQGLAARREFPQFRALATGQGMVFTPLSETIEVVINERAVEVRDTEGLVVSYGSTLATLRSNVPTVTKGARLFDLETWRQGKEDEFRQGKQELQLALSLVEPERSGPERLDLARFYFAHGMATETMGMLHLRETGNIRLSENPETRLMKGVSAFLTEDYTAAAESIYHPSMAGEWEAELWQAAMAAISLDWPLAVAGFAGTDPLIENYSHSVRLRLRLLAGEAHLGTGDTEGAERYLEQVRQDHPSLFEEAQAAFLVARRLYLEGDKETAATLWQRVAESEHTPSRARARLALLDLAIEEGSLPAEKAIEELERLRFIWRGDQFEFSLLQRLGDLYIAGKSYRKGLRALRQAASHFPDSSQSQAVTERMRDVFTGLYLGETSANLSPMGALTLFEEFKELTPPDARGDEVMTQLAERMVDVDLLGRASEILDSQVRYRLKGPAKARTGLRLATILLLDEAPIKALEALDISEVPGQTEDLVAERRRLKARIFAQLSREDEALALLGNDDGVEALRLRADILWRQKNWPAAVVLLERLAPEAPPTDREMTEAEGKAVVSLAVALTMAGEREKLLLLGKSFIQAMGAGPQKETFTLLVGDLDPDSYKTPAQELAQVDQVEAFLASYRKGR